MNKNVNGGLMNGQFTEPWGRLREPGRDGAMCRANTVGNPPLLRLKAQGEGVAIKPGEDSGFGRGAIWQELWYWKKNTATDQTWPGRREHMLELSLFPSSNLLSGLLLVKPTGSQRYKRAWVIIWRVEPPQGMIEKGGMWTWRGK